MLPIMRYQSAKLAQKVHQKKVYLQHLSNLNKIKTKNPYSPRPERPPLNISTARSQQYKSVKNRLEESHQHSHLLRSRQIKKSNSLIYKKVFSANNITSKSINNQNLTFTQTAPNLYYNYKKKARSFSSNNDKFYVSQDFKPSIKSQIQIPILNPENKKKMILRNHRQSPITKTTIRDRNSQNLRLANKLHFPSPTINTKKLQQIHQESKKLKERIMKYDSYSPKYSPKGVSYVDKRIISQVRPLNNFSKKKSNECFSQKSSDNRWLSMKMSFSQQN